jgi:ATP-binding cassette subfamily B protein
MSMVTGMGPAWRSMRADRSMAGQKLAKDTVRRVLAFAKPHRRPIVVFLFITVIDASLVIVPPLLRRRRARRGARPRLRLPLLADR